MDHPPPLLLRPTAARKRSSICAAPGGWPSSRLKWTIHPARSRSVSKRASRFSASDRGGIPELVHPDDRERVTAPLECARFCRRGLEEILRSGQRPARAAQPFKLARGKFGAGGTIRRPSAPTPVPKPRESFPSSASALRTSNVRNCSSKCSHPFVPRRIPGWKWSWSTMGAPTEADADPILSALEDDFAARGWQLLRQDNAGPGIARDRAARAAQRLILLFADDDDELLPHTRRNLCPRRRPLRRRCALLRLDGV